MPICLLWIMAANTCLQQNRVISTLLIIRDLRRLSTVFVLSIRMLSLIHISLPSARSAPCWIPCRVWWCSAPRWWRCWWQRLWSCFAASPSVPVLSLIHIWYDWRDWSPWKNDSSQDEIPANLHIHPCLLYTSRTDSRATERWDSGGQVQGRRANTERQGIRRAACLLYTSISALHGQYSVTPFLPFHQ